MEEEAGNVSESWSVVRFNVDVEAAAESHGDEICAGVAGHASMAGNTPRAERSRESHRDAEVPGGDQVDLQVHGTVRDGC